MPKVTINGTEIEVDKGTTVLRAAALAGYEIPHFCYHPALSIPANCRMCLVQIGDAPQLQPSCYMQVSDGMVVHTENDAVLKVRKAVLEFILINHPVDCPICDKAGECKLQDYYMAYDTQESRLRVEKVQKVKAYPIGPNIVYDGERCILCTRCVRFCEEISGTGELTTAGRGDMTEIRTFPGRSLDNHYAMCTVDVCPVGALTSRDFRFKCRVWLLTSTDSVCTGCAMGCNIHLDPFRNEIQRYRPRYNPAVNDYWMCDEGRLSYKDVHADRLLRPMTNGAELSWHAVAGVVADKLAQAENIAFVISPQASCEDVFAAKRFAEDVLETQNLYMGGKPEGFEDNLLIKADKNPNTRGIEAVFGGLDSLASFEQLLDDIESGKVTSLYMMGTETPVDEATRRRFDSLVAKLDLFILQSLHRSELYEMAHVALPACSHAEKNGTFVNIDGLAQPITKAFETHGDSLPDWQIFLRLASAMGKPLGYSTLAKIQDDMFKASQAPPTAPAVEQSESPENSDKGAQNTRAATPADPAEAPAVVED